jgi:hypothetical protein
VSAPISTTSRPAMHSNARGCTDAVAGHRQQGWPRGIRLSRASRPTVRAGVGGCLGAAEVDDEAEVFVAIGSRDSDSKACRC